MPVYKILLIHVIFSSVEFWEWLSLMSTGVALVGAPVAARNSFSKGRQHPLMMKESAGSDLESAVLAAIVVHALHTGYSVVSGHSVVKYTIPVIDPRGPCALMHVSVSQLAAAEFPHSVLFVVVVLTLDTGEDSFK
jgi:hypothetical protein